jgi:hypothetical protein
MTSNFPSIGGPASPRSAATGDPPSNAGSRHNVLSANAEIQHLRQRILFYAEQVASMAEQIDPLRDQVAELTRVSQDVYRPELARLSGAHDEFQRLKRDWYEPQMAWRAARICDLERELKDAALVKSSFVYRLFRKMKAYASRMRAWRGQVELGEEYQLIDSSELFDASWYAARYPEIGAMKSEMLRHFVIRGWREGRSPSGMFDTQWYLRQYPDVAAANINPVLHFIKYGAAEGRFTRASDTAPTER